MEPANIPHLHHLHHHHQQQQQHPLQDQLIVASSTTTTVDLSGYVAAPNAPAWTPNSTLNNGGFGLAGNAAILNSRNPRQQHHDIQISSLNSSMSQDLMNLDWLNCTSGNNFTNQYSSSHDLLLARIKREFSDSYTNFSEMISSPSSSSIEDVQVQMQPTSNRNEEFYCPTSSTSNLAATPPKRGTFSQIYPTINISNFNDQTFLGNPRSFDMNLQALDLLNSATFGGNFRPSMQDQLGLSRNGLSNYGYDYMNMKQPIQMPMLEPRNITPFSNGLAEAKRSDIDLEPKAPQAASKRSRLESRSSCPPLKVRKEKLGDRIAALQQLVAPFGKTDTASVLMEAIGYIKFLQNQVETLSVPYLKSSRNKTKRSAHGSHVESGNEERKRDLRSRGLCLVPMSCLSYVADSGGGVWPPPTFGGGT